MDMEQLQESNLNIDGARIASHIFDSDGIMLTLDNGSLLEISGATHVSYQTAPLPELPRPKAPPTMAQINHILLLIRYAVSIYPDNLEVKIERGLKATMIWIDGPAQPCPELMAAFAEAGFTVTVLESQRG